MRGGLAFCASPPLGFTGRGVDAPLPTPDDIDTFMWIDPTDPAVRFTDLGVTPALANDDPVRQISDKSGNDHHWTNAGGAARPLLKTASNLVQFDGVDDGFATPLAIAFPASFALLIALHAPVDTTWVTAWEPAQSGTEYFGVAQSGAGSGSNGAGVAVGANVVNGAVIGNTRGDLYAAIGTDPAVVEFRDVQGFAGQLAFGNYGGFEFAGLFGGAVLLDDPSADDLTIARNFLAAQIGAELS